MAPKKMQARKALRLEAKKKEVKIMSSPTVSVELAEPLPLVTTEASPSNTVTAQQIADQVLSKYPERYPFKALWEVLKNPEEFSGPEVVMAIITDRRFGLERRSTKREMDGVYGTFGKLGQIILRNATPLQVATLAGRTDVVECLIAAGADLRATFDKDPQSYTKALEATEQSNKTT